ncbi:MAG TPA: DUF4838 domain-containing protein [Candidatus Latescibacteria bacterium]|nr:DUF4838 domain-containing protein [Candidatus Latescibacterota bacterium]HOS65990.1 DUF4838 domain-containing protein [Candidatus Latescibacterota bacterium]
MKGWNLTVLMLCSFLVVGCRQPLSVVKGGQLVLAEHGCPARYTVVLPSDPSPSQVTAAHELVRYVSEMTGVSLPIATNTTPTCGIFLGNGADDLGADGFRLRATPPHFRIEGGRVHGTLFGVYDFLERYCGCEWFSPTTSVIPTKNRIVVSATLDDLQKPAFLLRDMNWTAQLHDWPFTAKLKLNGFRVEYPEEMGGRDHRKDTTTGGAIFDSLTPPKKFFKEHPDWFSLIDGKRKAERSQRCLTNTEFLDFLVNQMRERIKKNYPACKYYSIYQNDLKNACQCENCKKIDEAEGTPMATVLLMANYVAERIAPDYPDVKILTFSYMYTLKPPKTIKPHKNVMIKYCTDQVDFSKPLVESRWRGNKEFVENFKVWRTLTDQIYIWDYSANFKYLFMPFECLHSFPSNFRLYRDVGVVGVFTEGDHYGTHCVDEPLKTWVIAHLLWNPDQPIEPLINRFMQGFYGPASEVAHGYYDGLVALELKRDETDEPLVMWGTRLSDKYLPNAFLDEWAAKFTAALELVKDDPVRYENVYWARHNIELARIVRAGTSAKYSIATDATAISEESKRLQSAAKRILADFKRVKGLNGFRSEKESYTFVRKRVETVAQFDLAKATNATGVAVVLAVDLKAVTAHKAELVKDPQAVDGQAIRIDAASPDGMHHCIALHEDAFVKDKGGRIGIRVHARVDRTGVDEGSVFSVGTCDLVRYSKRDIRNFQIDASKVVGDGYAWYDIDGTWLPAGNETLWIGNGKRRGDVNPCIKAVFVDQIEIFRK